MSVPDTDYLRDRSPDRADVAEDVKRTLLTGAAVTVPLIITLLVLTLLLDFLVGLMSPVAGVLNQAGITSGVEDVLVQALALVTLVGVVFAVGVVAERRPDDAGVATTFDAAMERLPAIGSVYTGVNRMSEVLLDSDTNSFQEVKLVEFPHTETYSIAFLTASAPEAVEVAAGHSDMVSLFVPFAPNPFMGGQLITVPERRVHDVDMTVEEGVRAVVTSGVAVDDHSQ
jgi:uncharacterized membrane protein